MKRDEKSSCHSADSQFPAKQSLDHEIRRDDIDRLREVQARVLIRSGHDLSNRYPSIVRAASGLAATAIIDGEAIVQDGNGISDFEGLQCFDRS
jgi:ATP-dependent DNA ligase